MPTKEEIAWLAGILDGEGCIVLHLKSESGYHLCRVQVSNTDEGILSEVERILREWPVAYIRHIQPVPANHKTCFRIEVGRRLEAKFLLEQLLPYLKSIKKEKAEQFIDYVKSYKRRDGKKSNSIRKVVQYSTV